MVNKCLKMVQINSYKWLLRAPKGHVLVEDLLFASTIEAEDWCKAYISSWQDYSYEIISNKKDGDK
jgi:hypothetical protein